MKALWLKGLAILAACALLGATVPASAATITVSWTQSGSTETGPVVSLNFAGSSPTSFSEVPDVLSPIIHDDVTKATSISELDFTEVSPSIVETLAFQNVVFTAFTPGTPGIPPENPNDIVSFSFTT